MNEEFKSGFVTIIGRTNVGKSTLINLLVGEKVAAIANKVQTTRNAIKGIVNRENSQIVFTDTPGIHKPKHKLNETMVETSFATIPDSDIVLFLIVLYVFFFIHLNERKDNTKYYKCYYHYIYFLIYSFI